MRVIIPLLAFMTAAQAGSGQVDDNPPPIAAIREKVEVSCLTDLAAIEDMKLRREEIEVKLKEIAAKEVELKSRELAIDEQLKKLDDVREDIARIDTLNKKQNEERVAKLVETFETMSPKAAAQLLSTIDEILAVQAIARISTARLAKIMNVMEPGRSSRLTEILAGVARARRLSTSNGVAAATAINEKGGEKNDGNNNKSNANNNPDSSGQREPSVKKGKKPTDGEFQGALTQAGAAAQSMAVVQTPVQGVSLSEKALEGSRKEAQASDKAAQTGKSELRASSAEQSPLTQKPAASLNTAAAIAGLKPWSPDWVFQGDEKANADLQPLIPDGGQPKTTQVSLVKAQTQPELAQAKSKTQPGNTQSMPQGMTAANQLAGLNAVPMPESQMAESQRAMTPEAALRAKRGDAGSAKSMGPQKGTPGQAAAAGLVATEASNPMLEQLLQLDGESRERIPGKQGPALSKVRGPASASVGVPTSAYSELSGSEFVDTLMGVQSGAENAGRSEFKLIEGGGLKSSKRFNPSLDESGPPQLGDPRTEFGSAAGLGLSQGSAARSQGPVAVPMAEVTGHVVKGSMASDRLSHEALLGVSTQIRNLSPTGGGEIRVRLKPENLGELHVRVVTHGRQVALQIRASDEQAKKVIEDSMSHLKESLASQSLNLGRVDLSVASPSATTGSGTNWNDSNQSNSQYQGLNLAGQNAGQGSQGRSFMSGLDSEPGQGASGRSRLTSASDTSAAVSRARTSAVANGRLDVMA